MKKASIQKKIDAVTLRIKRPVVDLFPLIIGAVLRRNHDDAADLRNLGMIEDGYYREARPFIKISCSYPVRPPTVGYVVKILPLLGGETGSGVLSFVARAAIFDAMMEG